MPFSLPSIIKHSVSTYCMRCVRVRARVEGPPGPEEENNLYTQIAQVRAGSKQTFADHLLCAGSVLSKVTLPFGHIKWSDI